MTCEEGTASAKALIPRLHASPQLYSILVFPHELTFKVMGTGLSGMVLGEEDGIYKTSFEWPVPTLVAHLAGM